MPRSTAGRAPAALALRQRPPVPGLRSTVGTMSEVLNSPAGGPAGGRIVAAGRPAQVAADSGSATGPYLARHLARSAPVGR